MGCPAQFVAGAPPLGAGETTSWDYLKRIGWGEFCKVFPDFNSARITTESTPILRAFGQNPVWITGHQAVFQLLEWIDGESASLDLKCGYNLQKIEERATACSTFASVASYEEIGRGGVRAKTFEWTRKEKRCFARALGLTRLWTHFATKGFRKKLTAFHKSNPVPRNDPSRTYGDPAYVEHPSEAKLIIDLELDTERLCDLRGLLEHGSSQFRAFRAGDLLLVQHKATRRTVVLRTGDVGDVRRLLEQRALFASYWRASIAEGGGLGPVVDKRIRDAVSAMDRWLRQLHAGGCRGWREAKRIGPTLSLLVDTIDGCLAGKAWIDNSERIARKVEAKLEGWDPGWSDLVKRLLTLPERVCCDLADQKKMALFPMYCPLIALHEQKALYARRNRTGGEPGSPEEQIYQDFRLYERWCHIKRVKAVLGSVLYPGSIRQGVALKSWHKGYSTHGIPRHQYVDSGDVDLTGVLSLYTSEEAILMACNDKTCCPRDPAHLESEASLRRAPKEETKMLLYALQNTTPKSIPEIIAGLRTLPKQVMTGYRLEHKKDAGRMFFSAPIDYRLLGSVIERHQEQELAEADGNTLGSRIDQKIHDVQMCAWKGLERADCYPLLESTDMEKYSPGMDERYHVDRAKDLAEDFGIPELADLYYPMTRAKIHSRCYGRLISFTNDGSNFEGMTAKVNTLRHVTVRAYIRMLAEQADYVEQGGVDAVFVDDAGVGNFIRGSTAEERKKNVDSYRTLRSRVYSSLSWNESDDKNIESDCYLVFLNERWRRGETLRQGLKAAYGFAGLDPIKVETLGSMSTNYYSIAAGVAENSGPADWGVWMYHFYTYLAAERMSFGCFGQLSDLTCGLWGVTPMCLGGMGMVGALGLNSNVSGPATAYGIATLKMIGLGASDLIPVTEALINCPMIDLPVMDWLRDPGQFRAVGPRILVMRTRSACIEVAKQKASNPWLLSMIQKAGLVDWEELGEGLAKADVVIRTYVSDLYSSSYRAKVDSLLGKFQAADCIVNLIGKRKLDMLRRAARRDLLATLGVWMSRMVGDDERISKFQLYGYDAEESE